MSRETDYGALEVRVKGLRDKALNPVSKGRKNCIHTVDQYLAVGLMSETRICLVGPFGGVASVH